MAIRYTGAGAYGSFTVESHDEPGYRCVELNLGEGLYPLTEYDALVVAGMLTSAVAALAATSEGAKGALIRRYEAVALGPVRSDAEESEMVALRSILKSLGVKVDEPVARESIPPYPGDKEP